MAQITIDTDQLIARSIELEREKQEVLSDIAEHREDVRRTARLVDDAEFSAFAQGFYPTKARGVTRTPEEVQAAMEWKKNLLAEHGVATTNGDEPEESEDE